MARTDRDATGDDSRLLIERAADAVGASAAADRLVGNGERWGPYLLLWSVVVLDGGVLSAVQYVRNGFHPVLANPGWLLVFPVGLSFVVYASRRLRADYGTATGRLVAGADPPRPDRLAYDRVVSRRFRLGVVLAAIAIYATWLVTHGELLGFIVSVEGAVIGRVKYFLVVPVVYVPLAGEFAAIALGVNVRLPRLVASTGVVPDFTALRDLGGFRDVGALVARTTRYFFTGLALYTASAFTYLLLGVDSPYPGPGATTVVTFALLWFVGVVSFLYPVVVLHWHVRGAKRDALDRLTRRLHGDDDRPAETAEDVARYVRLHARLTSVDRASEYPVDVPTTRRFLAEAGLVGVQGALTFAVFPALTRLLASAGVV